MCICKLFCPKEGNGTSLPAGKGLWDTQPPSPSKRTQELVFRMLEVRQGPFRQFYSTDQYLGTFLTLFNLPVQM